MSFEGVEPPAPVVPVWRQPVVYLGERCGTKGVQPAAAIGTDLDEPRLAKHPEVLGHAGLRNSKPVDELAHRPLAATQQVEDPPP